MDDMNEHVPQSDSDLQPYSSTLPETFGYVPQLAENAFYQQHMVQAKDCDIYSVPQWIGEYLAGNGLSNMQGQVPYDGTGVGCSSFTEEPFLSMNGHLAEPRDVNPYVNFLSQQHEEVPVNNFDATQYGIGYQKQGPNIGLNNAAQHLENMSASTSGSGTKSGKKRVKYPDTNSRRKTRLTAALDALENVLPRSREVNKETIVDDCEDYIKSLQLHIKELSQNRLRCEPTSNHLQYLEGHGHYLVHENTATGPLDDILGKLLKENPTAATKLLGSKGLFMTTSTPN